MDCCEEVLPFLEAELREDRGARARPRAMQANRIGHDVANDMYAVDDAFARELRLAGLRGCEEPRREVVRDDPIELLGHRAVERSKARLHVRYWDAEFCCRKRVRER